MSSRKSTFRADAVSPAGAVGLMQVRPGTAQDMARARGLPYSRVDADRPRHNLEYGQSFIELMRRSPATGGQLPRVIAAYNAGPLPVARWAAINDKGDPLLWIESIPYWETRYYVPAVLRNMWVYQGLGRAEHADPDGDGPAPLAGLPAAALQRRPLGAPISPGTKRRRSRLSFDRRNDYVHRTWRTDHPHHHPGRHFLDARNHAPAANPPAFVLVFVPLARPTLSGCRSS